MKKQILIIIISSSPILTINAQWNGTTTLSFVGIGTPSPQALLHIKGNLPSEDPSFLIQNNANNYLEFKIGGSDAGYAWYVQGANSANINTPSNIKLHFNIGGANDKFVIDSNGKIGIGTSQPSEMLHIKNTTSSEIRLESDNGSAYIRQSGSNLNFYNSGERLTILNNGFIGIGTICPQTVLDVAGTIRAKEVKVELFTGCDFVFKSDYKLMDLKTLELFVKTNQHLPEIAPEKEMVENGVNMKELQMKLLQKIEELTLYTIEQNKKIEQLQKENIELKELKERIDRLEVSLKE